MGYYFGIHKLSTFSFGTDKYFDFHIRLKISSIDFHKRSFLGRNKSRCNSLSCPPGQLAPRGASCPGISCPPPWLSSPPGGGGGGRLSRPVYLAPRPTQVNMYIYVILLFFCIILMNSDPP